MALKKEIYHSKKSCGGRYEVCYTDNNIPYLKCEECSNEIKDWVKWDEVYKDLWKDHNKWEDKKDHLMCILGYFVARFKDYYDINFALSLNERGLFMGPEVSVLRKVYNAFNNDAWTVKNYIDWYFEYKIKRRKKKITSLSFLATPQLMNEYSFFRKKSKKITRDKKLPDGMKKWISENAKDLNNYVELVDWGDLHLMLTHYNKGHFQDIESLNAFVSKLRQQDIINDSYQIKNWSDDR